MLAFRDNRITDYLTLAQNRQTRWSAAGFLSFILPPSRRLWSTWPRCIRERASFHCRGRRDYGRRHYELVIPHLKEVSVEVLHAQRLSRQSVYDEVQRLPVARSSEYPAFRRDHWAVGRPSVRKFCLPANRWGQPVGESSHVSCRP